MCTYIHIVLSLSLYIYIYTYIYIYLHVKKDAVIPDTSTMCRIGGITDAIAMAADTNIIVACCTLDQEISHLHLCRRYRRKYAPR